MRDEKTDEVARADESSVWLNTEPPRPDRPSEAVLPNLRATIPFTEETEIRARHRSKLLRWLLMGGLVSFFLTLLIAGYFSL